MNITDIKSKSSSSNNSNKEATEILHKVLRQIKTVIIGKDLQIRDILVCWMAGGHILIEDVPGTGKTMLARALTRSVDVPFQRVQFTPDLLPSDIIGASIYRNETSQFEFIPGPLFTTVLLGDEINRATPRTQSALLEAMSEGQVSVDGKTTPLNPLFFTIATQNPVESLGTFPLPEAQLDRFMMKISMGYPNANEELEIIQGKNQGRPIHSLQAVETAERLQWVREQVTQVRLSDEVYKYIVQLTQATRQSPDIRIGASPRASIALVRAAQARALFDGLDHVVPSHVYELAAPVLAHRLVLKTEARLAGQTAANCISQLMSQLTVPIRRGMVQP